MREDWKEKKGMAGGKFWKRIEREGRLISIDFRQRFPCHIQCRSLFTVRSALRSININFPNLSSLKLKHIEHRGNGTFESRTRRKFTQVLNQMLEVWMKCPICSGEHERDSSSPECSEGTLNLADLNVCAICRSQKLNTTEPIKSRIPASVRWLHHRAE